MGADMNGLWLILLIAASVSIADAQRRNSRRFLESGDPHHHGHPHSDPHHGLTGSGGDPHHSRDPHGHRDTHSRDPHGHGGPHSRDPHGHRDPHSRDPHGHGDPHSRDPHGHGDPHPSKEPHGQTDPHHSKGPHGHNDPHVSKDPHGHKDAHGSVDPHHDPHVLTDPHHPQVDPYSGRSLGDVSLRSPFGRSQERPFSPFNRGFDVSGGLFGRSRQMRVRSCRQCPRGFRCSRRGRFSAVCSRRFGRRRFNGRRFGTRRACYQPMDRGHCRSRIFTRYYYDTRSRRCRRFYYSGCGGNMNRFQTLRACRRACTRRT